MTTQVQFSKHSSLQNCKPLWERKNSTEANLQPAFDSAPKYFGKIVINCGVPFELMKQVEMPSEVTSSHIDQAAASSINLSWVTFLASNHDKSMDVEEMALVVSGIHELIVKNDFSMLNKVLRQTLSENSSIEALITCLRTSFSVKHELSAWKELRNNAVGWIERKGRNPSSLLRGLA